jgi:hypothetical protein
MRWVLISPFVDSPQMAKLSVSSQKSIDREARHSAVIATENGLP